MPCGCGRSRGFFFNHRAISASFKAFLKLKHAKFPCLKFQIAYRTYKRSDEEKMSSEDSLPELILYYKKDCPSCTQVLDYLKSSHLKMSLKDIALDPIAKEELFHIGGNLQVPCLFIDGTPLYEAHFIIEWLHDHSEVVTDYLNN